MFRFRLFGFLVVVLVALNVLGSAQALSPNATNVPKYNFSGIVVNSVTGEPLRRVLVEVYAQDPHAMLTDSDGRFDLGSMPAGNYQLQVRKPGFFRESDITHMFRSSNVMLGPDTKSIVVKLMPEAVISGTVTDQDALPVPRFQVRVIRREIIEGRAQWNSNHQQVATDEYGQFRIGGLMPGTYAVAVGPSRQPVPPLGNAGTLDKDKKDVSLGYRQMYFPNAPDINSAALIQARPGQRAEANFTVTPEPFFSIQGAVLGGNGNVNVVLRPRGEEWSVRLPIGPVDQATGTFEAKFVTPGNYNLEAMGNDNAGHMTMGLVPLTVNRDLVNVRVTVQPAISIPVEVEERHVSTKQQQQYGRVFVGDGMRGHISVGVVPREPSLMGGGSGMHLEEGRIALAGLSQGRYALRLDAQAPWYPESATQGNIDLLVDDFVVTSSAQQQPIQVVLRDDGASLHVTLKGEAQEEGVLLVIPDRQRSRARQYNIATQGGQYIPPLKPGAYTLLAFDDVSDLEYSKPEVLEPYMSRAVHLTLNADEENTVKLDLIRRRSD